MLFTNNLDIVRIPLTGEKIYYLPKNTNFEGKKAGRIFVLAGRGGESSPAVDPYTDKQLISYTEYTNILITLKNKRGESIFNNIPLEFLLANQNSTKCYINDYIDWESSFLNIINADLYKGAEEILMYVTYDDVYAEPYKNLKNVKTITIPTITDFIRDKYIKKLSDYINDNKLGKLVKIDFSDTHQSNELWFSIYDKNGRCFEELNSNILSTLYSPLQEFSPGAQLKQTNNPIIFNYIDVDFERSMIFNYSKTNDYTLTFYFA